MGQKAHAGSNAHAFYNVYQQLYGSGSKVVLKQIYQSVRLLIILSAEILLVSV